MDLNDSDGLQYLLENIQIGYQKIKKWADRGYIGQCVKAAVADIERVLEIVSGRREHHVWVSAHVENVEAY